MNKFYPVLICILISGNLLGFDKLPADVMKEIRKSAPENSASGVEDISAKIPVNINGKDFIYLPELSLEKQDPQEPGQSKTRSLNATQRFGKFNNLSVVKKSSRTSSVKSVTGSNTLSDTEDGYILYDKSKKKFEVTHGKILFELKPGQNIAAVISDYTVSLVSKIGKQYIVTPNQGSTFIDVYSQISKDERLEYVRLMMVPPLNKSR